MPAPRVSILTAVYNPPRRAFEDTVSSVLGQTYDDWQWVLADDCSTEEWVRPRLRELAAMDPRIIMHERPENGGIVAASNDALARAEGELVALLDNDDVLAPDALAAMVAVFDEGDDEGKPVDYAYSDQDLITADGRTHTAYHKPDWSPERFRHHMYTMHLSVLRRGLAAEAGGFRTGFDGSEAHDLILRVSERARRIEHVGKVLYHRREVEGPECADGEGARQGAWDAGLRAVQEHLDRVGISARAVPSTFEGHYQVLREPDLETSVSIVIPTTGSRGTVWGRKRIMVTETIRSVIAKSARSDLEFVVVYDTPTPVHVLEELRRIKGARIRLVEFTEPFNFSAKCNIGALHAAGDVLIFLNDDIEAESDGVIEQLIAPLREPGVGLTGPKLLFEQLRVQHAGLRYGSGRVAHAYYRAPHDPAVRGAYDELWINREVTALTGACVAVRRAVFEAVGGFAETFPVNYNDVDFSMKVRQRGLRLLWLHHVVLFHFESVTRDNQVHEWERQLLARRWGDLRTVQERYLNNTR